MKETMNGPNANDVPYFLVGHPTVRRLLKKSVDAIALFYHIRTCLLHDLLLCDTNSVHGQLE